MGALTVSYRRCDWYVFSTDVPHWDLGYTGNRGSAGFGVEGIAVVRGRGMAGVAEGGIGGAVTGNEAGVGGVGTSFAIGMPDIGVHGTSSASTRPAAVEANAGAGRRHRRRARQPVRHASVAYRGDINRSAGGGGRRGVSALVAMAHGVGGGLYRQARERRVSGRHRPRFAQRRRGASVRHRRRSACSPDRQANPSTSRSFLAVLARKDSSGPSWTMGRGKRSGVFLIALRYDECWMQSASLTARTGWCCALAGSMKVTCPCGYLVFNISVIWFPSIRHALFGPFSTSLKRPGSAYVLVAKEIESARCARRVASNVWHM